MRSLETASRPARKPGGRPIAVLVVLFALGACGSGLSGTYASADGLGSLEFKDSEKVYVTLIGETMLCDYEVDGDRIHIKGPGGTQVFTRKGDEISGALGMTFKKT